MGISDESVIVRLDMDEEDATPFSQVEELLFSTFENYKGRDPSLIELSREGGSLCFFFLGFLLLCNVVVVVREACATCVN